MDENSDIYLASGTNDIVENDDNLPKNIMLYQNYPNPFNPPTSIRFDINRVTNIEIKIYDVNGREVATLIKEKKDVGTYTVRWDAANYPIGIYFYQMRTNTGFSEVNRMILIK